jgi:glycerol uptake facilitator-like aquaporin
MAERVAARNVAIALLANTVAAGAGLIALILAFGPVSGAHFNPVVTLADAWKGGMSWREVPLYLIAQFVGAVVGVLLAHAMFGEAPVTFSRHVRAGGPQFLSEAARRRFSPGCCRSSGARPRTWCCRTCV